MVKAIHIVNVMNYLFLFIGIFICLMFTKSLGDLLLYFAGTSLAVGIFSAWNMNSLDKQLSKTGFVWFVINMINIVVFIPLIIFIIFFGIGFLTNR